MSNSLKKYLFVCAALSFSANVFAQNIALVNGRGIPKVRADFFVNEQIKQGQPDSEELKKKVRDELIDREIMQQAAERKGLGSSPNIKMQMDLTRQAILVRALQDDFMKTYQPSETDLSSEYEQIKAQFGDKEYRARHILVETEEKAVLLIDQLKSGAKFEELAKTNSKDLGSAQNGGDLDYAAPANYVSEFSNAMIALEKGRYTEKPIKTQFGYHIILLEDVRPSQIPPLAEIKVVLAQSIMSKKWNEYKENLRSKAVIK